MYSKKIIAAVLTAALALGGVVGVAIANEIAFNASKRVEDLTKVENDAGLEVIIKADENDPEVKAAVEVLDKFFEDVKDKKDTFEVFGKEKADEIHKIIELGEDEVAEINEAGPFVVKGEITEDEVKFTFEFPTVYKKDVKVAFVLGVDLNDNGKIDTELDDNGNVEDDEWIVIEAKSNDKGAIEVTISKDVLKKVQDHASIYTVVNKPGAVEKYADTTKSNE